MTGPDSTESPSEQLRLIVERYAAGDRSAALALLAIVRSADDSGSATFHDVAVALRADFISTLRNEGRDADAEAGRLSLDEVREHLSKVVVPRLVSASAIELIESTTGDASGTRVRLVPAV